MRIEGGLGLCASLAVARPYLAHLWCDLLGGGGKVTGDNKDQLDRLERKINVVGDVVIGVLALFLSFVVGLGVEAWADAACAVATGESTDAAGHTHHRLKSIGLISFCICM